MKRKTEVASASLEHSPPGGDHVSCFATSRQLRLRVMQYSLVWGIEAVVRGVASLRTQSGVDLTPDGESASGTSQTGKAPDALHDFVVFALASLLHPFGVG